jgi:hypothetical protein
VAESAKPALCRSVASRFIQSSLWPSILSCDTSAGRKDGVQRHVSFSTLIAALGIWLFIAAGILTPIGLGETIVTGSLITAKFEYAIDTTPFGSETPPRDLYTVSRICGHGQFPCPGVKPLDFVIFQNEWDSSNKTIFDSYVTPNITNCLTSGFGIAEDLRTSPFEIQFRQYQMYSTARDIVSTGSDRVHEKGGVTNTTGSLIVMESLVHLDDVVVREGIIADLVNGGVGFRNHTVPTTPRMRHGAQWTEDILWLEPVTECVDTNWSVGHTQRAQPLSAYGPLWSTDLWLMNRGGGIVPTQIPDHKLSNPSSQSNPELHSRVYLAKSIFNYRLSEMLQLSSSNATVGSNYSSQDWTVWKMLSFWDFNGMTGLTLGQLVDPFNSWNDTAIPDKVELDPAQFQLSSFDLNAFNTYYQSLLRQAHSPGKRPEVIIEDAGE